ncbi:MAG TPA: peptidoglycan-associated lipoprotein Pal [Burkholderiales bacterium]|nr:peptidoglycan-associated lipoprotein Pal [Burkholderiales bacterium]
MYKVLFGVLVMFLLAGCASESAKETGKETTKAPVSEKPAAQQPSQQPAESKPMTTQAVSANPLTDPNNILSKRSIYYDFDKAIIKDEYMPLVKAHAGYLVEHRDAHITIQGNCDERGSREYNLALGQRRADGVRKAMAVLGAKSNQIETVSFGKEKPRCTEHNETCWAKNRRSDIVYQGEG